MNKEKLKHHAHPLLFLTGKSRTKLGRENAKIHKNVHRPPDITLWNSISFIRSASGHPSSNPDGRWGNVLCLGGFLHFFEKKSDESRTRGGFHFLNIHHRKNLE